MSDRSARIPAETDGLQSSRSFTFEHAAAVVRHLSDFGVSNVSGRGGRAIWILYVIVWFVLAPKSAPTILEPTRDLIEPRWATSTRRS